MWAKSVNKYIAFFVLFSSHSKILQSSDVIIKPDVNIKIENISKRNIRCSVLNPKYTDEGVPWASLYPNSSRYVTIPYTTKYGYFELCIDAEGKRHSYIPSGTNLEVTVRIKDDAVETNTVKVVRIIGIEL